MEKKVLVSKLTLLLTAFIWGAGFIFSQVALDHGFGPSALLVGKFGIAAVLAGIIFWKSIRANMSWRVLGKCVPIGVILAGSFFAQTFGLKYSSPSNCALITAAYVVITPFLWRLIFKRKPRKIVYFASVLCFIGVVILSVNLAGGMSFRMGDLWTLLAAVLFAAQIVATEAYVGDMDYKTFLFIQFATAAVISLAVFFVTERSFAPSLDWKGISSVVYLGCLSTCLCYLMQTAAQRYVPSGQAAILLSMEALFGAAMSVALGYDPMSARLLVGGGLVLVSAILPELAGLKKDSKRGDEPRRSE